MGTKSTTSIVVTSRNYGRYLDQCLRSILAQTRAPAKIILVDDGSEDSTPQIAESYPSVSYERVDFGNANRARNHGFAKASSEWVVFFDADNFMAPDFLESLEMAAEENPRADFVYCDRVNFGEGPTDWYPEPLGVCRSRPFDPRALRRGNYIDLAALLRSSQFPGFDESLRRYQDWDLWLTLVLGEGRRGLHLPQVLYYYRVHEHATTRREPADPALFNVRRKHGLGFWFRIPGLRNSYGAFRTARRLKSFAGL